MDIEGLLYRIISGSYTVSINGAEYTVVKPTLRIRQNAHSIYTTILKNCRFDTKHWLTRKQTEIILEKEGVWNSDLEEELKILQNRLDDLKIELYLKYADPPMKKKIKGSLKTGQKKINQLLNKKNSMDYLTLEYYAETAKNEYLLAQTIFKNGELAFDFEKSNQYELHHIISELRDYAITTTELKAVARSELWRSYWSATSNDIFDPPIYDWSEEQKMLISLTKMYENIYENPDRPEDSVIEDDDALEGWMIFVKRKNEKERKKTKLMDAVGGKYKNANEIFIVTNSTEEAKEIYSLNDAKGMAEINHIKKIMKGANKPIPWQDLPHVQMQIQQQIKDKSAKRQ